MPRSRLATRHGGCVIPFSGKEMRRRTRAEGLKFAHEMGLVSVPMCEGEVGPRKWRAHDRLPPGARKTRQPFEPFRRHADFVEKATVEMSRREMEFCREVGDCNRFLGAKQTIDRTDDQIVVR